VILEGGQIDAIYDVGQGQRGFRSRRNAGRQSDCRDDEEMAKAGILLDLAGLQPSSKGARIKFSGGRPTVVDGPFAETVALRPCWL
jgi:hypothetical protein